MKKLCYSIITLVVAVNFYGAMNNDNSDNVAASEITINFGDELIEGEL